MGMLEEMARKGMLDARLVKLLGSRFNEISALVHEAEVTAERDYQEFTNRRTKYLTFDKLDVKTIPIN